MENKRERLVLLGGLVFALALGGTLEFVKVSVPSQTVTVDKVVAEVQTVEQENGIVDYNFTLPVGYQLALDDSGNPYGYREFVTEEVKNIKLGDYLEQVIREKLNIKSR